MNLIVSVDENWAIGYNNELLVSIPDDMKFFRETTTGKVVIMGKTTLGHARICILIIIFFYMFSRNIQYQNKYFRHFPQLKPSQPLYPN